MLRGNINIINLDRNNLYSFRKRRYNCGGLSNIISFKKISKGFWKYQKLLIFNGNMTKTTNNRNQSFINNKITKTKYRKTIDTLCKSPYCNTIIGKSRISRLWRISIDILPFVNINKKIRKLSKFYAPFY